LRIQITCNAIYGNAFGIYVAIHTFKSSGISIRTKDIIVRLYTGRSCFNYEEVGTLGGRLAYILQFNGRVRTMMVKLIKNTKKTKTQISITIFKETHIALTDYN
jgi:hypothetical protein